MAPSEGGELHSHPSLDDFALPGRDVDSLLDSLSDLLAGGGLGQAELDADLVSADADLLGGVVGRSLHVAAQRLSNEERAKKTASDEQRGDAE